MDCVYHLWLRHPGSTRPILGIITKTSGCVCVTLNAPSFARMKRRIPYWKTHVKMVDFVLEIMLFTYVAFQELGTFSGLARLIHIAAHGKNISLNTICVYRKISTDRHAGFILRFGICSLVL